MFLEVEGCLCYKARFMEFWQWVANAIEEPLNACFLEFRRCFDNAATNSLEATAVVASWVLVGVMQNNVGVSSFTVPFEVRRG